MLTNPIVMCGPRGIKFLKPIELQIPHFISIDGQSWSYAFKTNESLVGKYCFDIVIISLTTWKMINFKNIKMKQAIGMRLVFKRKLFSTASLF